MDRFLWWLWADRTIGLIFFQHPRVAIHMYRMSTIHKCYILTGFKQILMASRAFNFRCVLHTSVGTTFVICIATPTLVAMIEVFTTIESAYPTVITMKLLFWSIIIKQLANSAKVFPHFHSTITTNLINWLFRIANYTNNLLNISPDNVVPFLGTVKHTGKIVVAMVAPKYLVAARSTEFASPTVMLAPMFHLPEIQACC